MLFWDLDYFKRACLMYPPDMGIILFMLEKSRYYTKLPYDEGRNILAVVIEECVDRSEQIKGQDGRYVPSIVETILQQDFEVADQPESFSRECWVALVDSTRDEYVVDIAKVLLKYGISPPCYVDVDGEETYLDYVARKESEAYSIHRNMIEGAGLAKLYELIEQYML